MWGVCQQSLLIGFIFQAVIASLHIVPLISGSQKKFTVDPGKLFSSNMCELCEHLYLHTLLNNSVHYFNFIKKLYPYIRSCAAFLQTQKNAGMRKVILDEFAVTTWTGPPPCSSLHPGTESFSQGKNKFPEGCW